jgi:GT2 family glycosyltransferase
MNLSIIIPNYNGQELLKKNLPLVLKSVKNYKEGKIEIIIPDDPSTDNSKEVIKDFIANISQMNVTGKTISNTDKKKAGFSKNVNRGVSLAIGDILILLNSDVVPHEDFLEAMLPHFTQHHNGAGFADPNVFAVACMDESIEDGRKILRGRGIGRWEKGFLLHSRGNLDRDNTLWASGGSSAFTKKIWDKIGGLDEIYNPYYWEDNGLSYRALKAGYKIIFEKKSIVIHEHEKGTIRTTTDNSQIKKIAYRNQFIFVWLNITDRDLLLSHILWLPYHLLTSLLRKDWYFYAGLFSALQQINKVLEKRKNYTKLFIKTDKEILEQFKT